MTYSIIITILLYLVSSPTDIVAGAEVETLLREVEPLVVGAGQVQAVDTAEVQPGVGGRVGGREAQLLRGEPDVQLLERTHRVGQRGLEVGEPGQTVAVVVSHAANKEIADIPILKTGQFTPY